MIITPQANLDLLEIGDTISIENLGAAKRFRQKVEYTFQMLVAMPELGERCSSAHPKYRNVRIWRVSGFSKYLIFYRIREETLEILRVVHGARNYRHELKTGEL